VSIGRNVVVRGDVTLGDGVRLGDDVSIEGRVTVGLGTWIQKHVEITGNVGIGDQTVIGAFSSISTMPSARVTIGNDVLVNVFSVLGASQSLEIKDHCIFAAYVQITDASHGIADINTLTKHAVPESSPVVIEKNVWLGSAAMVMKGVTIGEGAVIGAKALVTQSIPPFAIAYGIPARVARIRGGQTGKS
jgi:acetyltransferase-like isoleucine patch superfamily enzyme